MASSGSSEIASAILTRSSGGYTRCVFCDVAEPDSGKLLHCFHVACAPCLQESVSGEGGGYVHCVLCSTKTTAPLKGVDLTKQLADCTSLLYDSPSEPGRQQCEFCQQDDDNDFSPQDATHECADCDGFLLCTHHAERHTKTRRFQDHRVEERGTAATCPPHCPIHPRHDVTDFCLTCEYGVCERCQAVGHSGHAVESIASAAVKYEAILKETLQKCNTTATTGCDAVNPDGAWKMIGMATLQNEVAQAKLAVEKEAEAASRRITQTFEDAQKLLEKQKEKLLHEVDTLSWQRTQPLLEKDWRLSRLEDQYSNAMTVAQRITGCASNKHRVIQIAAVVQRNVQKLQTQLEAEKTPVKGASISARAQPLSKLEACLQSLVSFSDASVDVRKPLEILLDHPVRFDPTRCPAEITMSSYVATHTGQFGGVKVGLMASEGYVSGRHKWQIKIRNGTGSGVMAAGVTVLPAGSDPVALSFFKCCSYSWYSNGTFSSRPGGNDDALRIERLQDGDVISFTLVCEAKSLEIYNHRTGERHVKTGIQCNEPLYPAFRLYHPGQAVEIGSVLM